MRFLFGATSIQTQTCNQLKSICAPMSIKIFNDVNKLLKKFPALELNKMFG